MYLSWTDDVPIVYRPIAAPRENLQDECLTLMGVHVGGPSTPKGQCVIANKLWLDVDGS